MKKILVTFVLIVAMLSFVMGGCAKKTTDTSWTDVQKKGQFLLGLDEAFPPMGFKDGSKFTGFDIDVATEVCKRLGITLVPTPINWDLKEQELNTKKIDCIWNGLTITADRQKKMLFSDPYMDNRQVLVVKADSAFTTLASLNGKSIALQAGSSAADALDANPDFKKTVKATELDNNEDALMNLDKGSVQAVLMDEIVARYMISMKGKAYRVMDDSLAGEEYGIGFRTGDKALRDKVQETLNAMAKDGTLATISKKWFAKDITTVAK